MDDQKQVEQDEQPTTVAQAQTDALKRQAQANVPQYVQRYRAARVKKQKQRRVKKARRKQGARARRGGRRR